MSLGENIRLARQQAKLSQEALGELIGVSKQAISLIENGKTEKPDKRTLKLLAQTLNNDFGEPELTQYLFSNDRQSREEILSTASGKEIYDTLRFNGGAGRYTREEMLKIKKLMDEELKRIDERNALRRALAEGKSD